MKAALSPMRFLVVASLVLVAACARAQTLDIVPSLKAGDVNRLEVSTSRDRALPGRPRTSTAGKTPVELRVVKASDKGFVVAWRQGRTTISSEGQALALEDPGVQALLELAQQTVFELTFDASAEFTGLRNYEQVGKQMEKMLDGMFELAAKKTDDERARRGMDAVRALFSDRKRLEAILLRDVLTFFFPLGKSFPVAKPHTYDTVLPNPLGGEPLGARGTITVDSVDRGKNLAQVTLRQAVSPDAMRIMIESMLKAMPDAPRPSPQELAELRGEISDEALFVLDLSTGWPLRTEYTRTVRMPGGGQVQKVTITRTP